MEVKGDNPTIPVDPRVVIDDDDAKEKVKNMINDQRSELKKFDDTSNILREQRGGSAAHNGNITACSNEDLIMEQKFDDVEITDSKIL